MNTSIIHSTGASLQARSALRTHRRQLLQWAGAASVGLLAVACGVAPSPTPAPSPPEKTAPSPAATVAPSPAAKAAPTAAPAQPPRPVSVKLAHPRGTLVLAALGLAKTQKFFEEFGVDLDLQAAASSVQMVAANVSGEVLLSQNSADAPLAATSKGQGLKILGLTQGPLPFAVFARPGITSLKDLAGKSVGTSGPGAILSTMMLALLQKAGVDAAKVDFVNIGGSPDVYRAVVAGKIDAGPSTITFIPSAEKDGVKVISEVWKELPDYINLILTSTEKAVVENRDALARTLAGFMRTHRYIVTDASKDLWIKVAGEVAKEDPKEAEYEWRWLKDNKGWSPDLALTKSQTDYVQEWNIKNGAQSAVVPFEQVVDLSVRDAALKLLK